MAAIINERDKFLQAQSVRINRVPIEIGDVNGLQDALNAVKNITVTASANAFIRNISNPTGPTSPTSITLTANLNGLTGTVSWSVVSGTLTISPSGNNCTITGANMTSYTAVIRAQLYANGKYYQSDTVINRLGAAAGNDKIPPDALTAGTLAAGVVYAGEINADNITAGTLTGRTVRTAASGARVEMQTTGTYSNQVVIYDSSGNIACRFSGANDRNYIQATTGGTALSISLSGTAYGIRSIGGAYGIMAESASAAAGYFKGTGAGFGIYAEAGTAGNNIAGSFVGYVQLYPMNPSVAPNLPGLLAFHNTNGLMVCDVGGVWKKVALV